MNLCEVSELMAVSIGMNFAFFITSLLSHSHLSSYLKLYFDNSNEKVSKLSLESLLEFQDIRGRIDFRSSVVNNNHEYDIILSKITVEENKIKNLVGNFYQKSKACLELDYLPHISLILGLYALIIMGIIPFYEHYELPINLSLLTLNTLMVIAIIITIYLQTTKKGAIGYKDYLYYFGFSLFLFTCSFWVKILNLSTEIIDGMISISLISIIIIPFFGVSYYLLKAFFINEYQIHSYKSHVEKLGHKEEIKVLNGLIDNFELKENSRLSEDLSITIGNEN